MSKDAFRIEPTADTRRAIEQLAHLDVDRDLRREINSATQSVVREIRAEIASMPSTTGRKAKGKGGGLRAALARNVKKRVRMNKRETTIAIELTPHGGLENLARAVEGDIPWQHPVYGEPGTDVTQPPHPFFMRTIASATAALEYRIRAAVQRAVDRAAR
jgi:hypothetical protein